jgi:hypothetical protein
MNMMRISVVNQSETAAGAERIASNTAPSAQLERRLPAMTADSCASVTALQHYQQIANSSPYAAQLRQKAEIMAGTSRITVSRPAQTQQNSAHTSTLQLKGKHKKHVDVIDTREHEGHQGSIQRKMVEVCRALLDGNDDLEIWFGNVVANGLCGGWAALHRAAPDLLLDAWEALEDWEENEGVDALTEEDQKKIVAAVTTAYDTMNTLEPGADYGESPEQVRDLGMAVEPKNTRKVSSFILNIPQDAGGGRLLLNKMLDEPKVKKGGNICTFHIETQRHHMSMRTRTVSGKIRILDIVESERRGVVRAPTTAEAIGILDSGLYLDLTKFDVEVEVFLDTY